MPHMIRLTLIALALVAGAAHAADAAPAKAVTPPKPDAKADAALAKVIHESFVSKGPATVERIVDDLAQGRTLGILGDARVNVLALNLAVARLG